MVLVLLSNINGGGRGLQCQVNNMEQKIAEHKISFYICVERIQDELHAAA